MGGAPARASTHRDVLAAGVACKLGIDVLIGAAHLQSMPKEAGSDRMQASDRGPPAGPLRLLHPPPLPPAVPAPHSTERHTPACIEITWAISGDRGSGGEPRVGRHSQAAGLCSRPAGRHGTAGMP